MEEKTLTPKESLNVINEMIAGAKARMNEDGFIYLFWGWLILICALSQFILLQTKYAEYNYFPYFLVIPGAIYTAITESRKHRRQESPDYMNKIMSAIWITAGVNMMIAGFVFAPVIKTSPVPIILIVLGLATIISGAAVKFKPLVWGGIICNAVGIASVFFPYSYHPLIVIIAIIAADLVPGYILRKNYKKSYA
jgi:hypothetical protein